MPVNSTEPPPTASNAAENRPDAIATVHSNRSPLAEPAAPTPPVEPVTARDRSPDRPPIPTPPICRHHRLRGPAPSRNSETILAACLVTDQVATSFSALAAVPSSNISVPARAARHYGEFASGKPDSDCGGGVGMPASSPSVIVDHPKPGPLMSPHIEKPSC